MSDFIKSSSAVLCVQDTQSKKSQVFEFSQPVESGRVADAAASDEVAYWAAQACRYGRVAVLMARIAAVAFAGAVLSVPDALPLLAVLLALVAAVCVIVWFRASMDEDAARTFQLWSMPAGDVGKAV